MKKPWTGAYSAAYLFFSEAAAEGANPECELLPDGAGNLWGTARFGGSGNGVLFKFTPATATYTAVVKFTGTSGSFYRIFPR